MKKKFSDSAAPAAARKAVPGPDRLSPVTPHRQSSLPMPGAALSPVIDFLFPDVIRWKRANLERDWIDATTTFWQPDFTPVRAPELAFYLMQNPPAVRLPKGARGGDIGLPPTEIGISPEAIRAEIERRQAGQ